MSVSSVETKMDDEDPKSHNETKLLASDSNMNKDYHSCKLQMPSAERRSESESAKDVVKRSRSMRIRDANTLTSLECLPGDKDYPLYLRGILKKRFLQWDEYAKLTTVRAFGNHSSGINKTISEPLVTPIFVRNSSNGPSVDPSKIVQWSANVDYTSTASSHKENLSPITTKSLNVVDQLTVLQSSKADTESMPNEMSIERNVIRNPFILCLDKIDEPSAPSTIYNLITADGPSLTSSKVRFDKISTKSSKSTVKSNTELRFNDNIIPNQNKFVGLTFIVQPFQIDDERQLIQVEDGKEEQNGVWEMIEDADSGAEAKSETSQNGSHVYRQSENIPDVSQNCDVNYKILPLNRTPSVNSVLVMQASRHGFATRKIHRFFRRSKHKVKNFYNTVKKKM